MTPWGDNRARSGGRRQRTRRYVGALWSALAAPTSLSANVRLGSGRYGYSGWTRHSGPLGGRPRYRAGIAALCSWRAAVCATAAMSAERSPGASVRAAGARSGKPCGVPGVRRTGSGQTGLPVGNVRTGRSTPTNWPHTRHAPARTDPLSPLPPPLSVRWPHSAAGLAAVRQYLDAVFI